jgi:hypothetical protein
LKTEKNFLLEKLEAFSKVLGASTVAWIPSWMQFFFLFDFIKKRKTTVGLADSKVYQHNQCSGSMTFGVDPDPRIYASD